MKMTAVSIEEVQNVLTEFYSTSDQTRRQHLHELLLTFQSSCDSYQCAYGLLSADQAPYSQHFGTNLIYEKLVHNWSEFIESKRVDHVCSVLLARLEEERPAFVRSKLSSCLAVYILRTVPDIWLDPITDLIGRWSSTQPIILLQVLSELPTQFRCLTLPVDHRGVVKTWLHKCAPIIAQLSVTALQSDVQIPTEIVLAAVTCVSHWLDMPGTDLKDWQTVVFLCLQKIQRENCQEAVSKFLTRLADHDQLDRLENFVSDLLEFATTCLKPMLETSLNDKISLDEEQVITLTRAIVTLLENHTRFISSVIAKSQSKNNKTFDNISALIRLLLRIIEVPGCYPVDEQLSEMTLNFWNSFHDDIIYEDEQIKQKGNRERPRKMVLPWYSALLQRLIPKLRQPSLDTISSWDVQSKEEFAKYRVAIGDTLCSCYRIIGHPAGLFMLDSLKQAQQTNDLASMEALIFGLESVGDWLTCEDPTLMPLIDQILPQLPLNVDDRLANSTCRLIDKLTHLVVTSDHRRSFFPTVVSLVLPFIKRPTTAFCATMALEHLTHDRSDQTNIQMISEATISTCYEAFCDVGLSSAERLRALRCLGYVLSTQPFDTVMNSLDQLLVPRLVRLEHICSGQSNDSISENDLLFELDIVSKLIGSLEGPVCKRVSDENVQSHRSPVLLVLEQSFPLFQSLWTLSAGNVNVAKKLSDALRQGLVSLTDQVSPLVPNYCQLLGQIYTLDMSAFTVARTLFLLFAKDQSHRTLLGNTLIQWTNHVLELSAASDRNPDVLEAFLTFCQQLVKKEWKFLESSDANSCVSVMVDVAASTLETAQEPPLVKQAALFLSTLVALGPQSPLVINVICERGGRLVPDCYNRLSTEILTSSVEYLADVLFIFAKEFPRETRQCLQVQLTEQPILNAMLYQISNKRKFREMAKKINLEARHKR